MVFLNTASAMHSCDFACNGWDINIPLWKRNEEVKRVEGWELYKYWRKKSGRMIYPSLTDRQTDKQKMNFMVQLG